jgi:putative ABC transport system permease protein
MRAIIALAAAAAVRRWRTLALVGVTVGIAAFLACLALLLSIGNAGQAAAMFERAASPDFVLIADERTVSSDRAAAWWRERGASVRRYPVVFDLDSVPLHDGRPMNSLNLLLTESLASGRADDLLLPASGFSPPAPGTAFAAAPGPGEIWITQAVAQAFGVREGDTVSVMTSRGDTPLRVAAVAIDPFFNPGMMNPRRAWVAPGFIAANMAASAATAYTLAVDLGPGAAAAGLDAAWRDFSGVFGYSAIKIAKTEIVAGYSFLSSILAAVLSFLAGIAFLGALAILQATVASTIRADYKIVGMYQTMGLTPAAIAAVFLCQLMPAILVFSLAGAALAPAGYALAAKTSLAATGSAGSGVGLGPLLLLGLGVSLLSGAAAALISARHAGGVRTADAIRMGESAAADKAVAGRRPLSAFLPLWASLGFRQARLGGKRSIATAAAVLFAAFAGYASVGSLGAMADLSRKPDFFGVTESQVTVQRNAKRFSIEHERLMAELAADPSVRTVLAQGYVEILFPAAAGAAPRALNAVAYDGDIDDAGLGTLTGRNPAAPFEAAVAVFTARDWGLEPGSTIGVSIRGQAVELRVVGVYQSMNNLGQGLRLTGDTLRALVPDYDANRYDVFLRGAGSGGAETPAAFVARIEARYGEAVDAQTTAEWAGAFVASILSGMYGAVAAAAALFLITAAAAMAGATAAETREQAKAFAVLSLIGLEDRELRWAVAAKAALVSLIAAAVGVAAGVAAAPTILYALIRNLGLVEMPFFFDVPAALAIALAMAAWSTAAAWLTARFSLRARARDLVME